MPDERKDVEISAAEILRLREAAAILDRQVCELVRLNATLDSAVQRLSARVHAMERLWQVSGPGGSSGGLN